jgi:acetoin utilization deacetylase AcuC-like enzyme
VVVAIKRARRKVPDIRIAYVDIDAHHGDGVEAAFAEEPAVLTISVHESGRYLFPGTGDTNDIGRGPGLGSALSLPLPMHAGPKSFEFAWREAILPALEAFGPDLIVLQGGADSHRNDPITHLGQTVEGYAGLVGSVLEAADRLCGGRAVLLGGGGYRTYDEAPRMWACAVALWLDRDIPLALPASWLQLSEQAARRGGGEGCRVLKTLAEEHEDRFGIDSQAVMQATEDAVARARSASPLLGGSAAGSFGGLEEQLADLIDRELDAGV